MNMIKLLFSRVVLNAENVEDISHIAKLWQESKGVKYYYNNTVSTMVLAKYCLKYGVKQFVFSSSATVYGENEVPFVETMRLLPTTNPYGETKVISEQILTDIAKANPDFSISLLRYFNPVGAHESGLIGEDPAVFPII